MLGLLFIYFLGNYFYKLADQYQKNQWGYALVGVISYYAGSIVGGIVLVLLIEIISPGFLDSTNEHVLGLLAVPLGFITSWGLYKYLESRFKNEKNKDIISSSEDILDDEFLR